MRVNSSYKGLVVPSLIWIAALAAAAFGALLRGIELSVLWPLALAAAAPAVLTLILTPILRKEWVQILTMFAWLTLAIVACLTIGFIPMAVLFLCAPAVAALFEKEKVVEALVMAAIIAGVIYYAGRIGSIPQSSLSEAQMLWGKQAGLMATLGLVISTLLGASLAPRAARLASGPAGSEMVMDAIDGGVMRFDTNDKMIAANKQARALFDVPEGTAQVPLHALISHDDDAQTAVSLLLASVRKSKEVRNLRLETRFNADHITYLDLQASPVESDIVLHAKDVTLHEESLEAMRQTQAVTSKATDDKALFFAGVSHELRTPLNAIIGFSDMMRSRLFGPLPGKYAEYADLIHDSGQHMLDLIGDVLDMSKVEAGKYELNYNMFDASDVVRSTVKMIRPTADAAEVRLDINIEDDEQLLIDADRKAVRQILLNLLSNAIKFSPKGGAVHIGAKAAGDTLNLTVQDHGSGMSDDELAVLGTPYKQMASAQMVENRGTGLGFTLVKSLTELHGGRFAVASQKDEGTTVDIFLPLSRD